MKFALVNGIKCTPKPKTDAAELTVNHVEKYVTNKRLRS